MASFSYCLRRLVLVVLLAAGAVAGVVVTTAPVARPAAYIVQAANADAAAAAVTAAGGAVTARLGIINGVAARLDPAAAGRLQAQPGTVLHLDGAVHPVTDANETY